MTGARAEVDGTPTEARPEDWHRISTPASSIGPWLPEGALGSALADGLARVEVALGTAVGSEHPFVREAAGHLMSAGGKRFRPMLALLAAQLGDPRAPGVTEAAVVCELTHLATLYHDDVMDEAAVRRGAPSANSRWSNSIAILTGDLLFARASDLLADLGPEAVRIQAQTFERLVTGQIRETVGRPAGRRPGHPLPRGARRQDRFAGGHVRTVRSGLRRRRRVTGDRPDGLRRGGRRGLPALRRPARHRQPGRGVREVAGTDLREGIATLPALFALAGDDPADARLRELVARPVTDDEEHAEALALLRSSAALTRANDVLGEYADRARARLDAVPAGDVRDALSALCDYVVTRTS